VSTTPDWGQLQIVYSPDAAAQIAQALTEQDGGEQ
jgi:NADPH-dependent 7-cyano-7-deazaguanine reductase QueF